MNTKWYNVHNGEVKIKAIMQMIEHHKHMMSPGYIKSHVIIFLPDGRHIKGVYTSKTDGWSMEWVLAVPNGGDETYGVVRFGKITNKHGDTVLEIPSGDDERECIRNSLQTFLLDNKYKIAVI